MLTTSITTLIISIVINFIMLLSELVIVLLLQSPNHFLIGFRSETDDTISVLTQKVQNIHGIHDNPILFIRDLNKKQFSMNFSRKKNHSLLW